MDGIITLLLLGERTRAGSIHGKYSTYLPTYLGTYLIYTTYTFQSSVLLQGAQRRTRSIA